MSSKEPVTCLGSFGIFRKFKGCLGNLRDAKESLEMSRKIK